MKRPKFKYIGGVECLFILPSGREVTLAPGDTIDALASEVGAIGERSDFEIVGDDADAA